MGIFNSTFRQHIIDELNFRKSHEGRQQAYHPTARVTALVEGNLNGQLLRGFTLGPQDVTNINKLDQLTNIHGNSVVVGTTYVGGNPQPVRLKRGPLLGNEKKNLPAPGVTNISISTQSKGGLVFKATVNLKFYGKEQYDFIYQTFMRPGNPILIEYGHTTTAELVKQFNDLDFFHNLDDKTVELISDDINQVSKIQATRNSGAVAGRVSNFKISLNEENEYEASIDIINALEFLFTLSPEDTVLSYKDTSLATSIKNNFGYTVDPAEYSEEYDFVFQRVLEDLSEDYTAEIIAATDYEVREDPAEADAYQAAVVRGLSEEDARAKVENVRDRREYARNQNPNRYKFLKGDDVFISLNYLINRLVGAILKQTVVIENNVVSTIVKTSIQIREESKYAENTGNLLRWSTARRQKLNRLRKYEQEIFDMIPDDTDFVVNFSNIAYWATLRSNNVKNVIINNDSIYIPFGESGQSIIEKVREPSYRKKFRMEEGDQFKYKWFEPVKNWDRKSKYTKDSRNGEGIFINYQKVRYSFINSNSVAEAIVRILNLVNQSTTGVLDLKFKNISSDVKIADVFKEQNGLVIYDQNALPSREEFSDNENDLTYIYNFFENNTSEVISYNFDFSLPSSVASTVMANSFNENSANLDAAAAARVVNDPSTYQLLINGYVVDPDGSFAIKDLTKKITRENSEIDIDNEIFRSNPLNVVGEEPDREDFEAAAAENLEFYLKTAAYVELAPPSMKSEIILSGLFNTLPTSAKVSIKLVGLDGFRFGDMFSVEKILPTPYDKNNIFMLTGYKHDISSDGWFTTIDGIMIASTPKNKRPFTPDERAAMLASAPMES